MMYDIDNIIALWQTDAQRPGEINQELDTTLVLPIILGCTPDSLPYIMLLTEQRPKPLQRLEAIDIQVGRRENARSDENWSLVFVLQDWSLVHAFAEICVAFADRIADASSKEIALHQVYITVDQWQRLLKTSRDANLMKILRGVFGELIAALEITKMTGKTIEEVCQAWTGPYESPQDFVFPVENNAWEVKADRHSAKKITISSPEQLNTASQEINLVTVELEDTTNTEKGLSLPNLIDLLRRKADNPAVVSEYIENGLSALGLSLYASSVSQTLFTIGTITTYKIANDFPCIRVDTIPNGVMNLTYQLDKKALTPFVCHQSPFAFSELTEA